MTHPPADATPHTGSPTVDALAAQFFPHLTLDQGRLHAARFILALGSGVKAAALNEIQHVLQLDPNVLNRC